MGHLERLQIIGRCSKPSGVVFHHSDGVIAGRTEKPAHVASDVIVIDGDLLCAATDVARSCAGKQSGNLRVRQSVSLLETLQMMASAVVRFAQVFGDRHQSAVRNRAWAYRLRCQTGTDGASFVGPRVAGVAQLPRNDANRALTVVSDAEHGSHPNSVLYRSA